MRAAKTMELTTYYGVINTHIASILQTVGEVKQSSHLDYLPHAANLLRNVSHSTSQNPFFPVSRSNVGGRNGKRRKEKTGRRGKKGRRTAYGEREEEIRKRSSLFC